MADARKAAAHRATGRVRDLRKVRIGSVAEALGGIEPGVEIFALTHGQFSLLDALVYLSQEIGPSRLSVCTWTAGVEDLQYLAGTLAAGRFTSVRWLVDRSFITRQPAYVARLRELYGDDVIRTTRAHAKFCTLVNERFTIAVRTSMNLNHNPRMETIEISDDPALCGFLDAEFDRHFIEQAPGLFDAELIEERVGGIRAGVVKGTRIYATRPT